MASNGPVPQMVMRILQRLLLSSVLVQSFPLAVSWAQITLDGSLGPGGALSGPNYRIDAELGQIHGSNLFHSFGQFNVQTGERATFAGPHTIANIVSRVTGGQQSLIDGLLRSEIAGANLYLLNPNGVLFGPNASLDVRGSFHVSTADFLRFADGAKFSAHLGQESVLTVAPPVAFGFWGSNPAGITIDGSSLKVSEGKAVSVVGGDITIIGSGGPVTDETVRTLLAPSGRIHLASVASPGEVVFSPLELAPKLQVDSFARLGRLALSQGALVDVSGNGGGTVLLRGGHLLVDRSSILADTLGHANGAILGLDLRVAADAVIEHDSLLRSSPLSRGAGNGGNIVVDVGRLTLTDGSAISSASFGSGQGGDLTVAAADAISISGRSGLFSNALSIGDAGRLFVSAPTLTMDDGRIQAGTGSGSRGNAGGAEVRVEQLMLTGGAQIDSNTRGSGRGGDLSVVATDAISIAGSDSTGIPSGLFSSAQFGRGNAGNLFISTPLLTLDNGGVIAADTSNPSTGNAGAIEVRVGRLMMSDGAQISTSTFGSGRGGDLSVAATEAISITGRGSVLPQTGLFSVTNESGDAGRLFVSAPLLDIAGGRILARTLGGGNAGDLEVRVGRLTLTNGAQIFNGTGNFMNGAPIGIDGPGRGGNLTVMATDAISIAGSDSTGIPSGLFSSAQFGRGNAGNLFISTPLLTLDNGGVIAADTSNPSTGNAGAIEVRVGRLMMSDGAQISTSTFGSGRGGDLSVAAAEQIELSTGGTISSSSASQGNAGNIVIQAGQIFRSQNGAVTTEAEQADGGDIQLTAESLVDLRNSQMTATVKSGVGKGGNITLDTQSVVSEGSQIRADAFGGPGGNVRIVSDVFLADPLSRVSASSTLGIQGTVDIRAPVTSLSGALAPLPQAFVDVATLLPARCVVRLSGSKTSSLVVGGREGLPLDPGGILPSPLVLDARVGADPAGTGEPHRQKSSNRFALLGGDEKALPRVRGAHLPGESPRTLIRGCAQW